MTQLANPRSSTPLATDGVGCPARNWILVVDDEPALRAELTEVLHSWGYPTLEAGDGIEAVLQYQVHHRKIGLVLMDSNMPWMDGKTAFRTIRAFDPSARGILSSASVDDLMIPELLAMGWDEVLMKPYRLKVLEAALARTLVPIAIDTPTFEISAKQAQEVPCLPNRSQSNV